jgi:hypothetical protein
VSDYGLLDDRGSIHDRGFGAHPTSYPKGTGGPFPGGKARPEGDADYSPPSSSAAVKNEELSLLSAQAPSWRVTGQLYFTFALNVTRNEIIQCGIRGSLYLHLYAIMWSWAEEHLCVWCEKKLSKAVPLHAIQAHGVRGGIAPRAGLDAGTRRKIPCPVGDRTPVVLPVVSFWCDKLHIKYTLDTEQYWAYLWRNEVLWSIQCGND